ncbi:MAG: hypothetical protein D5R99_02290 [Methanocalculus sp. MSAO_Arc1]|uniref:hypothetical protein n=1 Tax=Methanocalculus TaxID=71151 RepID=UPI000FED0579|nr:MULTISPECIES: hypothetical protein [unclassified Methanocalculus]MCP1661678.1 hypothetical protein [Methanocalculus sp. AMF5]RQD81422.1 MAG: hypothetical protein D5R99_02290 [Methanocalculus sp. MSAO_Arc1]
MRDDAVVTFDFLVGFTIFIIAFIFVAAMVPHTLFSVQSAHIDYDAVAYRTGVILTEDPGMPASPDFPVWEQEEPDHVVRMGLAAGHGTAHILSGTKVARFFDGSFQYPDDFRRSLIFGDYPYSFHISLTTLDEGTIQSVGPTPPEQHGIVRRVVVVRGNASLMVDDALIAASLLGNATADRITIEIPMETLLESSVHPLFKIDPRTDYLEIGIRTDAPSLNLSGTPRLHDIRRKRIPISYTGYTLDHQDNILSFCLLPQTNPPWRESDSISITFAFDDPDDPPEEITTAGVVCDYDVLIPPPVQQGILEVAVW